MALGRTCPSGLPSRRRCRADEDDLRSSWWGSSRRLYRRAASLDRRHSESYAALGQLAVVQGDLPTARKMLKKARRLDALNQRTAKLASMISSSRG